MWKIGILREEKLPPDNRVPLTPDQCLKLERSYGFRVLVQPSSIRAYSDKEYLNKGIALQEDLSDCDVLFGVKEVPPENLIPYKTYFFFSHTIKKQPHNRKLLQEVLRKQVTLIDYECLKNANGQRLVAFGRFAGLVGAYHAIRGYGLKYNLFQLDAAYEHQSLEGIQSQLNKAHLKPGTKIVLTGGGRVAGGAKEILDSLQIKALSPDDFMEYSGEEPVYCQLKTSDYHRRKSDGSFDLKEFYEHPERYEGTFLSYAHQANILIAGAYWDPESPVLFQQKDIQYPGFRVRIVADITCDIEGSIPSTIRPSTISDPYYDVDPLTCEETGLFANKNNITVMAVDNLPNELARDASLAFGDQLINHVFPEMEAENSAVIENAVIARNGALTSSYKYLSDFAEGG